MNQMILGDNLEIMKRMDSESIGYVTVFEEVGAGSHSIAVQVIDNEGLEALEINKLKVNDGEERENQFYKGN